MIPLLPKVLFQTNEHRVPQHIERAVQDRAPGWDYHFYTHENIIDYFAALQEDDPDCKPLHDAMCEAHDIVRTAAANQGNDASSNGSSSTSISTTTTVSVASATGAGTIKLADILQLHEVFMYYYLYKHGGAYMDTGVIMHEDQTLSAIVENAIGINQTDPQHQLVAIESCLTPVIFAGFMACTPRHPVLRKVIQHMCSCVADFRQCCSENTKFDVATIKPGSVMHTCCKEVIDGSDTAAAEANVCVKLLSEVIPPNESRATIYDKNSNTSKDKDADVAVFPLFHHYFMDKIVRIPLPKTTASATTTDLKDIKIGISAAVPSHMFNNGIHQNTLYFYDVLKHIGYTPYLIVTNADYQKFKKSPPDGWNSSHYENVISFSQIYRVEFQAVVTFGVQISHIVLQQLRHMGVKLVSYVCGNEYLINSEAILYGHGESGSFEQDKTNPRKSLFDEVWLIPQMMDMNECYKRTLSRCAKVIEAPFIWSPKGIETIAEKNGTTLNDFLYINSKKDLNKSKRLATFDPNISIMKWFLPSFVLCERAYQLSPQLVDRIYITNAFRDKIGDTLNAKKIENTVRYTDLFLDKRVFFEKRFITFEFMKTHADVAVFHQWGNPLNYIYLEMAWLGYPFVHNAHLCADLGYYYEGHNLEQGAEVLLRAIMKHDSVSREYLRINRERVDRYLPTNAALQQKYKKMFDDLFYEP
uniref:Uncharacterized protein n=1 Tax=viral metagenome TaxID=1070528 RepID=A0A6C0I4C0_9ZZZZ